MLSCADGAERVYLIDALYHDGVCYHFEKEIEEALEKIYTTYDDDAIEDDMYTLALRFCLLRQNEFHASSRKILFAFN